MHYADQISVVLIFAKILVPSRKRMTRHFILLLIIFLLSFILFIFTDWWGSIGQDGDDR